MTTTSNSETEVTEVVTKPKTVKKSVKKEEPKPIKPEKKFVHFMVDVETLGVIPNKNPVLQIAAVMFDPDTFEPIGDSPTFECFLPLADQLKLGRTPDEGTVKWWSEAKKVEVAKVVFAGVKEAPPLKTQLFAFSDWISEKCKIENGYAESVFWAKPTLFDYPFIDGLFLESGVPSPFHFRKVVDMSSYIISAFKNVHYAVNHHTMSHHQAYESYWASFEKVRDLEKEKDADGERSNAHNASADCIFQLDWLKEAIGNCAYYISEKGIQETLTRKD